jgi:hypothetical protein
MYILKLNNGGEVALKWGYWAMRDFCKATGKTAQQYFEMLGDGQALIDNMAEVLLSAAKYATPDNKYTFMGACEWVDNTGGVIGNQPINGFISYLIGTHTTKAEGTATEEKKS